MEQGGWLVRPRVGHVMKGATQEIGRLRKLGAFVMMAGSAGLVAKEAFSPWGVEWLLLAFAGVMTAAGVGITRRSLVVQVLSRGAAWIVLLPCLLVGAFSLLRGSAPPAELMGLLIGTASALLLARPMLHTKEALASFHPRVFRRWFLGGSTATSATALVTGGVALETIRHHQWGAAAAFGALTLALLASAIGVVKMRGWGILLGALTSVVLLLSAAFLSRAEGLALALAATPTLFMHVLPVLLARAVGGAPASSSGDEANSVRVEFQEEKLLYRVASHESAVDDDDTKDERVPPRAAIRA